MVDGERRSGYKRGDHYRSKPLPKYLYLPLFAASLLAFVTPAVAQAPVTTAVSPYVEVEDEDIVVPSLNITVDELEDLDIYTANGDEVGEVETVLADGTGQIAAIVGEVGGFLGIGDRRAVIGLDQVGIIDGRLVTSLTEEQLEQLPTWDD